MTKVAAALVTVALALAACTSSAAGSAKPSDLVGQNGGGPFAGVGLVSPLPRPQFTLTTTAGKPYSFSSTMGRTTLLFFGYTQCLDECPAIMADIGNALRGLPSAVQRKVTVVFASTDVKHDSGPVIARWLRQFSPGSSATFVGLRGTQAQIDAAQGAAHLFPAEDGGTTHSTQILLYGPDNYAHVSFLYNEKHEQQQIAHDVPLVVKDVT